MAITIETPTRRPRNFVAPDFQVTDWAALEPYFQKLAEMPLDTVEQVEQWLRLSSELTFVLDEDKAWRFIQMTRDTTSETIKARYDQFSSEILPQLSIQANELLKKLYNSPAFHELPADRYLVLLRSVKKRIELFREENVPLGTEIRRRSREFDEIASGLFIEDGGQKLTLQKAAAFLESNDRSRREEIWRKIINARLAVRDQLNQLFSDLLVLRTKVAHNADFESFADYKFQALGRFDYARKDCYAFHAAIEKVVRPQLVARSRVRAQRLGVPALRHWDLSVDETGKEALHPFQNAKELIEGCIRVMERLSPSLAGNISRMQDMGHLDLESRLGKAPGGYNYSLPETGVPFIFMNAVGTQSDLTTMLHEAGHAQHSFYTQTIDLAEFKHMPAELAELASMSMELITLDFLDEFYKDDESLRRARREQLMRPLTLLPWIASIDAFQFWLYDHPEHTIAEREAAWMELFLRFHGDYVSWEGEEDVLRSLWQKQGHIYDVPFYYIEYGIAQLGAIAVWRNYRQNPEKGLSDYLHALSLGYTRPIPEVYEAAGIRFDFSEDYIRELIDFVVQEIERLDR
ncbi:MAG: M3 family oligoendopeptidase [Bacteroidia bacterium]